MTMADFQRSFSTIVPSTYRGVDGIVESLPVKWEDIAGYEQVKQALRQVCYTGKTCFLHRLCYALIFQL